MAETQGEEGLTRIIDGVLHIYNDMQGWINLGWAAHTLGTAVWLTPAAPVEALNVSRDIGERTVARLRAADVTLPVINIPGPPDRWALLARPSDGPVGDILAMFAGRDVGYAYIGHHEGQPSQWGIDLPPTQHPGHEPLTWVSLPDKPLPLMNRVAHAVRDVLTDR